MVGKQYAFIRKHALKSDLFFFFFEQTILHSLGVLDGDRGPHLPRAMHSQGKTTETLQCCWANCIKSILNLRDFQFGGLEVFDHIISWWAYVQNLPAQSIEMALAELCLQGDNRSQLWHSHRNLVRLGLPTRKFHQKTEPQVRHQNQWWILYDKFSNSVWIIDRKERKRDREINCVWIGQFIKIEVHWVRFLLN